MNINRAHKIRVGINLLEGFLNNLQKKNIFYKLKNTEQIREKNNFVKNSLPLRFPKNVNFEIKEAITNLTSIPLKPAKQKQKKKKNTKKTDISQPLCFGDIIYLSFNYFNSNSQKIKKAVLYGEILSGNKITGRCTKSQNFDISISKSLFQILPKSPNLEKNPYKSLKLKNIIKNRPKTENFETQKKAPKTKQKQKKSKNYVLFGQTIILKHIFSNCYLTIDQNSLSIKHNSLRIILSDQENENCHLKIKPTCFINNLGGVIKYSDLFFLCKAKEENIFVTPVEEDSKDEEIAIEGSNRAFEWKMDLFLKKEFGFGKDFFLKSGDIVRIKHSEMDCFLSLGINRDFVCEKKIVFVFRNEGKGSGLKENEVVIRKKDFFSKECFSVVFEGVKELSIYSLWEIKGVDTFESEDLGNDNEIRFKNVVTGQYIALDCYDFKIKLCDFENLDCNSVFNIKKKIAISLDKNLNYEDVYKIKNIKLEKHLIISEKKVCTKEEEIKNWKLEKEIYKYNFKTKISKTKKKKFTAKWGKTKNSKCLFKFQKITKESTIIHKLTSIKQFLIKFYNFIFEWGVKKNENSYHIEYTLLIEQIKYLKENFQIFQKFMKHLTNLNLQTTKTTKTKKTQKNITNIGITNILINIIELIDTRIYKSLIEIVDYSFKDQSDFGKYKKLKNYFQSNKMVNKEYSQIIGKNILDKVVVVSLNYLSICCKSDKKLLSKIHGKFDLFLNLSFFYREEVLSVFKEMSKSLVYENQEIERNFFLENFFKNFFLREDDFVCKIRNLGFYKEIVFNIVCAFSELNDLENLKDVYFFLFENLKVKFVLDSYRQIKIQFFCQEDCFERIKSSFEEFSIFVLKNNCYEADLGDLKNEEDFLNKFIIGYLEITSAFFKTTKNFKFKKNVEKHILNIKTVFEGIKGNYGYHFKKIFYEILTIYFFYQKNLTKIDEYLSTNSINFYENIQKDFDYKRELPINWINSEKIKEEKVSKILEQKKIINFISIEFKNKIDEFCQIIKSKKESELKFLKELFIFIKNGILYGLFNYTELKMIYEKILKFLCEIQSDINFEKNDENEILISKNNFFRKKNEDNQKKIFLWIYVYYKIQHISYYIIFLVNQSRLFLQINFIASLFCNKKSNEDFEMQIDSFKKKEDINFREIGKVFKFLRFGPLKKKKKKKKKNKKLILFKTNRISQLSKKSRSDSIFLETFDEKDSYHFEEKFLEYNQIYYEKIKILEIFWKYNFSFNDIKYFKNLTKVIKKIQKLSLSIYSDYFNQREYLYKLFQHSIFFENKQKKIFLKIDQKKNEENLSNLNTILKNSNEIKNKKNYLQKHKKDVEIIFQNLNKNFEIFFQQKIFFHNYQNFLVSKNYLNIITYILNNDFIKNLPKEDFLIKNIFKFIEYILLKNTYNQVLFFRNFNNIFIYFKKKFNTTNIIISLLSFITDFDTIFEICNFFLDEYKNFENDLFKVFLLFDEKENKLFLEEDFFNCENLNFISNLNKLFISLLISKKGVILGKIKKLIFFFLLKEKIIENIFSHLKKKSFKSKIKKLNPKISKSILKVLTSFFDLISEIIQDNEFTKNCFKKTVSLEKFIYIIFTKGSFFLFKSKILKIFSLVYLENPILLIENDYTSNILENTILKDLNYFNYFLKSILPLKKEEERKKEIITREILNEIEFFDNKNLEEKNLIDLNIISLKEEFWGYLCKNSFFTNYGLLYFIYDFLNIFDKFIIESNFDEEIPNIYSTEYNKIIFINNKIQEVLVFIKKALFLVNREFKNMKLGRFILIINDIFKLSKKIEDRKKNYEFEKKNTLKIKNQNNNLGEKDTASKILNIFNVQQKLNGVNKIENYKKEIVESLKNKLYSEKKDFYFIINDIILKEKISPRKKFCFFIDYIGLDEDVITFEKIFSGKNLCKEFILFEYFCELEKSIFEANYKFPIFNLKYNQSLKVLKKQKTEIQKYLNNKDLFGKFYNIILASNYLSLDKCEKEIYFLKKKIKKILIQKNHNKIKLSHENIINLNNLQHNKNGLYVILFCIKNILQKKINKIENLNNQLKREEKIISFTELQNNFQKKNMPKFLLEILCTIDDHKIDIISIKILVYLLKYGNKNIQRDLYNLLFGNKEFIGFFIKLKYYMNFFKKQIYSYLDSKIAKTQKKKNFFIKEFYKKFYCIKNTNTILTIFMLIQNLCENCFIDFQLLLSNNKENNIPINFLKKTSNFFVNFSEKIFAENISNKNPEINLQKKFLGLIPGLRETTYNEDYKNLIEQTYLTLEDFILGPCEKNLKILYQDEKLGNFLKKIAVLKMDFIQENHLISIIFTSSIKLISLLVNENTKYLLKYTDRFFNKNALCEQMVNIFENYIKGNEENFKREVFCDKFEKDGKIFSKAFNNCALCTSLKCTRNKITKIQLEFFNTGFEIFSILKTVNFFKKNSNDSENSKNSHICNQKENIFSENTIESMNYYQSLEDQVEICYNNKIINFKFKIPFLCFFKNKKIKEHIIEKTVRTSHYEKIENFISNLPIHIEEMKQSQKISSFNILSKFLKNENKIYTFRFFLIILLNLLIVANLEYDFDSEKNVIQSAFQDASLFNLIKRVKWFFPIYIFFCIIIFVVIIFEITISLLKKKPVIDGEIIREKKQNLYKKLQKKKKKKKKPLKLLLKKLKQNLHILSPMNLFLIITSLLAIYIPFFWSVILLDIISKNKEMRDIVKSITLNSLQLIKTVILALIVMYIYSFFAFSYFPNDYTHDENQDFKNYCYSLTSCFISTVYNGMRAGGGIGEALGHLTIENEHYWFRLIFDLSFFIFVIICLLNIIFGIIIDTFADLRDKRNEFKDLVASKCFVCEQKKFKIESMGEGWKLHNEKSHSIVSYLHFFIFLEKKSVNDCSGVEKYVKEQIFNNDFKFVPHLTSLSIEVNKKNGVVEEEDNEDN